MNAVSAYHRLPMIAALGGARDGLNDVSNK